MLHAIILSNAYWVNAFRLKCFRIDVDSADSWTWSQSNFKMYSSSPIIFISTTIVLVRFILVQCVLFKVALRDQKIIALEMTHELTLLILFTFGRIFSKLALKSSTWHIEMRKENQVYLVNNSKTIPQKFNVIRTGFYDKCYFFIFNISS